MRKSPASSTVVPFSAPASRSFDRRPLPKVFAEFTCLVLVKHQESASGKAPYVSDNGDILNAVWVPKAMLGIDRTDRGKFIVATVSKAFAGQKRLDVGRFKAEWCDRLTPDERAQLVAAQEAARRTRQRYRGHHHAFDRCNGRDFYA